MSVAITPDKFDPNWAYKYVRFADGKVLFCEAASTSVSHANLKDEHSEAPPFAAGTIRLKKSHWAIIDGGSTTLNIPRRKSDEKYIGKELEKFGLVYDEGVRE